MKSAIYLRAIIALLITLSAAYYQRTTGPTYEIDVDMQWKGIEITGELTRNHTGEGDQAIAITLADTSVRAVLIYRRFKINEEWTGMKMTRDGDVLYASLPHQPPAGKLEYFLQLHKDNKILVVPQDRMIVTRFKGDVPGLALVPHIIMMFLAMFLSTWTGIEALYKSEKMYILTFWTTGLFFLGGMILGPIVQKYAFGAFWTGVPFGFDLTDNKALLAMIGWAIAAWMSYKKKSARLWIIIAALILLTIYFIPHSLMGSELNYQTMEVQTGQ